jgi:hypothetical protein
MVPRVGLIRETGSTSLTANTTGPQAVTPQEMLAEVEDSEDFRSRLGISTYNSGSGVSGKIWSWKLQVLVSSNTKFDSI